MIVRKQTNGIMVGNVKIGDFAPVSIQSMITTDPVHTDKAIAEINRLADAGCEIVRVAVPNMDSAKALKTVKAGIHIPSHHLIEANEYLFYIKLLLQK